MLNVWPARCLEEGYEGKLGREIAALKLLLLMLLLTTAALAVVSSMDTIEL